MNLLFFILFFLISWAILMYIFSFSTYHKYFKWAAWLLIGYSILTGFLFSKLIEGGFFIYYLIGIIIYLSISYRKQKKAMKSIKIINEDNPNLDVELSMERTLRYHFISSVIFIVLLVISYLYFFNLSIGFNPENLPKPL